MEESHEEKNRPVFFHRRADKGGMRRILLISAVCGIAILGAVLLTTQSATNNITEPDSKNTSLNVVIPEFVAQDVLYKIGGQFEEETGIAVQYTIIPENAYQTQLQINLTSGIENDLFIAYNIAQYLVCAQQEHMENLYDTLETQLAGVFSRSEVNALVINEELIFGLPILKYAWVVVYNKDLMREQDVLFPTQQMTWEEYAQICREMTFRRNGSTVYGGMIPDSLYAVASLMMSNGTYSLNTINYDFLTKAYEFYINMQQEGLIPDYTLLQSNNLTYRSLFFHQHTATCLAPSVIVSELLAYQQSGLIDSFEWGVADTPVQSKYVANRPVGSLGVLCVNKNAQHKSEAIEFLFYTCFDPDAITALHAYGYTSALGDESTLGGVYTRHDFTNYELQVLALDNMVMDLPSKYIMINLLPILQEEHDTILTGTVSVEQGIRNMTEHAIRYYVTD